MYAYSAVASCINWKPAPSLRVAPQASSPDRLGRVPLHCAAATSAAPDALLAALLVAAPSCAALEDGSGRLPLHCAAGRHACSAATLRLLLSAHPAVRFCALPPHSPVRHVPATD